jgi:hypothetical protein
MLGLIVLFLSHLLICYLSLTCPHKNRRTSMDCRHQYSRRLVAVVCTAKAPVLKDWNFPASANRRQCLTDEGVEQSWGSANSRFSPRKGEQGRRSKLLTVLKSQSQPSLQIEKRSSGQLVPLPLDTTGVIWRPLPDVSENK